MSMTDSLVERILVELRNQLPSCKFRLGSNYRVRRGTRLHRAYFYCFVHCVCQSVCVEVHLISFGVIQVIARLVSTFIQISLIALLAVQTSSLTGTHEHAHVRTAVCHRTEKELK